MGRGAKDINGVRVLHYVPAIPWHRVPSDLLSGSSVAKSPKNCIRFERNALSDSVAGVARLAPHEVVTDAAGFVETYNDGYVLVECVNG